MMSSLSDETPEGKSIVELARESGLRVHNLNTTGSKLIKFSAETKMFRCRFSRRYSD